MNYKNSMLIGVTLIVICVLVVLLTNSMPLWYSIPISGLIGYGSALVVKELL